ncbi:MAG: hypothetical protein J6D08_00190 [Lachnospiraceae bacterium]|nr:hypothetical protein [Lachnospiraceae bacterium]
MGKSDICRVITFYNDYIPNLRTTAKWEFCTFGVIDGINVSKNITGKSKSIEKEIWTQQEKLQNEFSGEYTAQQVYIIRNDDIEKENAFWENNELPFYFFCRIQCDGEKFPFLRDRTEFERAINGHEKLRALTYLTYDNTDLFIVIKTSEYALGSGLVNQLHQKINLSMHNDRLCILKNSFTVMAVRNEWLKQADDRQAWLKQQEINTAYINLIKKPEGNLEDIENAVKNIIGDEKVYRTPVLGTDDEMLVLSGASLGQILALYKPGQIFGQKMEEGSLYRENIAGMTTKLCTKVSEDKRWNFNVFDNFQFSEAGNYQNQVMRLRDKLSDKNGVCIRELNTILNVLPKFSGSYFNDYLFFPMVSALDVLIDLMHKSAGRRMDKNPFYDYLTSFCLYAQNAMLSDRHSAQILGFNTKIYDIPVKLNAFYNAFIYRVKSILNRDNSNKYCFIAVPGIKDFVSVVELYKDVSENQRLIKVEIPEYSFYNIRNMMRILAHETAHYVGTDLRNRDGRVNAVVRSYSHSYVEYIKCICRGLSCSQQMWVQAEKRLDILIVRHIGYMNSGKYLHERYFDIDQAQCDAIAAKNDAHLMRLLPNIHEAMKDIINYGLVNVFSPFMNEMEKEDWDRLLEDITQASLRFVMTTTQTTTIVNSQNVLNMLMSLYAESFADLISVLVLNLSAEDYLTGLVKSAENQGMEKETLINTEAILRISSVINSCLDEPEVSAGWKEELKNSHENDIWYSVAQEALWLARREDNTRIDDRDIDAYNRNVFLALKKDKVVLTQLIEYLTTCIGKFKEKFLYQNPDKIDGEIQDLRTLFSVYKENSSYSGEEQIIRMMEFIECYRKDIQKETGADSDGSGDQPQRNKCE